MDILRRFQSTNLIQKPKYLVVWGLLALLLTFGACSGDQDTASETTTTAEITVAETAPAETVSSKRGGTLKVGMLSDHVGFDPPVLLGMPDIYTIIHTNDVLVFRNADLTLRPALAES